MLDAVTTKRPAMAAAGFLAALVVVGGPGLAAVAATKSGSDLPSAAAEERSPSPSPTAATATPAETAAPIPSATPVPPVPDHRSGSTTTVTQAPAPTKTVTAAPKTTTAAPVPVPPPATTAAPPPPPTPAPIAGSDARWYDSTWQSNNNCYAPGCQLYWNLTGQLVTGGSWTSATISGSLTGEGTYWIEGNQIKIKPNVSGAYDEVRYTVTGPGGSSSGTIRYSFQYCQQSPIQGNVCSWRDPW